MRGSVCAALGVAPMFTAVGGVSQEALAAAEREAAGLKQAAAQHDRQVTC